MQLDFFNVAPEPKTLMEVCLKELKAAYFNKDEETIKLAIRFAGFMFYEDEKLKYVFYGRVSHYIKHLHDKWGKNWENKYAHHRKIEFHNKNEPFRLIFKEDLNLTLWI